MPRGEDLEAWPEAEINARAFNSIIPGRYFGDASAQLNSISFSRTGLQAIVSTNDDEVYVYDLGTGQRAKTVYTRKYGASHVKFMTDATFALIASTKIDHTIRYLDILGNHYTRLYAGHEGRVTALHTAPEDTIIMSLSEDRTLRLWEPRSQKSLGVSELQSSAVANFDEQGSTFAIGSVGSLKLYDLRNFNPGPFSNFAIPSEYSTEDWVALRYSPCGRYILISTNTDKLLLIDAYTGAIKHVLQGHLNTRRLHLKGSFSPDSRFVVCGSSNKKIHVWSTETGELVHSFHRTPHQSAPLIVEWNPAFISFLSADKKLVLWNPVHEDMTDD